MLDHPIALQLRNLQVLGEIAVEHNSTIVFPAQFLDSVRTLNQFIEGERSSMPAVVPPQPLPLELERQADSGATTE